MKKVIFLLVSAVATLVSCGDGDDSDNGTNELAAPTIQAVFPLDGAKDVPKDSKVYVLYDQPIKQYYGSKNVTVNGNNATVHISSDTLFIDIEINPNTDYTVSVPQEYVYTNINNVKEYAPAVSFKFSSYIKEYNNKIDETPINVANAGVKKLYQFLLDNYGQKIISGTMADVSVSQNEAKLVKAATGKTPLMQTFDFCFVNFTSERSTWEQNSIYQDISYYKSLWEQGGIVSACWHLNVPSQEAYAQKNDVSNAEKSWNFNIYFSANNAVTEGTWENEFLLFSFDKAVEILQKYKDAGIPVVWRPFHEGSGNAAITGENSDAWFWWGKDGSQAYKKLWVYMFDYFRSKGLDNLIWVWTTQVGLGSDNAANWYCNDDSDWYPGDQYVDIIVRDNYDKASVSTSVAEFEKIHDIWDNKMLALGENGNIAKISEIFVAGGKYSYFMPWYTYGISDLDKSDQAKLSWWQDAASSKDVLFLEDID